MSINTNSTLQVLLSWSQAETDDNNDSNTITDEGNYLFNHTWTSGTGYGEINQLWHTSNTLTSGESHAYNITGLTRTIFDNSYTQSFSNIRAIYFENTATGTGISGTYFDASIIICATGNYGISGIFDNSAGNNKIAANSPWIAANPATGWPVIAGQTQLFVKDAGIDGSGSSYQIGIVGLS
jgi:hypothetical protein